jgi:hypothetical protein
MSDDLVIRLRTSAGLDDVHDAADLIETQSARIAELETECTRLRAACGAYLRTISLSQMRHGRILVGLERRTARQRRALAKLYRRRHDKNARIAELDAEVAQLRGAINNALLEPWSDGLLNGTWHQEPIGPNETPEEAIKRLVSVRIQWAVSKDNNGNPVIIELRAALEGKGNE